MFFVNFFSYVVGAVLELPAKLPCQFSLFGSAVLQLAPMKLVEYFFLSVCESTEGISFRCKNTL